MYRELKTQPGTATSLKLSNANICLTFVNPNFTIAQISIFKKVINRMHYIPYYLSRVFFIPVSQNRGYKECIASS